MVKNQLTIIACSGSILAATLFTSPSHAMPLPSFSDGNRQIVGGLSLEQRVNPLQSTQADDQISPSNYEKRLQQAAFAKFGCGCGNCVSTIRQQIRSGELSI